MEGLFDRYGLAVGESQEFGSAKIFAYEVTKQKAYYDNIGFRSAGLPYWYCIQPGNYVVLTVDREVMMSDTPMEKITNEAFIMNARGKVLIGGLGLGLLIHNLIPKIESGEVEEVTIIENNPDVIALVRPFFRDLPLRKVVAICDDVYTWKPAPGSKFDTIYFDIWAGICADNTDGMKILHKRYKKCLVVGGWMDSWLRKHCLAKKRADTRFFNQLAQATGQNFL